MKLLHVTALCLNVDRVSWTYRHRQQLLPARGDLCPGRIQTDNDDCDRQTHCLIADMRRHRFPQTAVSALRIERGHFLETHVHARVFHRQCILPVFLHPPVRATDRLCEFVEDLLSGLCAEGRLKILAVSNVRNY